MRGPLSIVQLPVSLAVRAVELGLSAVRGLAAGQDAPSQEAPPPARPSRPGARAGAGEPPPAPPHVTEQAVPVATFADAGAEAGVGAQIEVAEPWEGYDRMSVAEIAQQLSAAPVEVAAAVRLYEPAGRSRKGVLDAAERRLRTPSR